MNDIRLQSFPFKILLDEESLERERDSLRQESSKSTSALPVCGETSPGSHSHEEGRPRCKGVQGVCGCSYSMVEEIRFHVCEPGTFLPPCLQNRAANFFTTFQPGAELSKSCASLS